MTTEETRAQAQAVQAKCLKQLAIYQIKSRSGFSWPMDRIANQPYGYAIHVAIINAWNKEDRVTPCVEFHRNWLSDIANIEAALAKIGEPDAGT